MRGNSILFHFPEYESLAKSVNKICNFLDGDFIIRKFPDGESYLRLKSDVKGKDVYLLAGLDNPDLKSIPIMFFASLVKENGARSVTLIAPYLGYLRQDKIFNEGEALTAAIFGKFLSGYIDCLITIDPHLHRIKSLGEIFSKKSKVLHATNELGLWINKNVKNPFLIGPDEESRQWTQEVAKLSNIPFVILKKSRQGDHEVTINFPDISQFSKHTPVLIDDIISSGATMIEAARILKELGMNSPIGIAVHGIFAQDSYQKLKNSPMAQIVTCNSIEHSTNQIDLSNLIASALL
jgi:ribose-phosphate pyrophosphokinase